MDDVEQRIDAVLRKRYGKGKKHNRLNIILLFIVMASLGSVIAIPFFQRKDTPFDAQEYLVDELNKNISDVGSHPAYSYWYPPNNSFGIGTQVVWNNTWVKNKIKNNVDWMLESNTGMGWYFNNDSLTVGLRWNETGFYKVWFNVSNLPLGDHRITFYSNVENLSSMINKTDDEIWIYYPVGNETLTLMFNYSDLKGLGLTFKSGKYNGYWYFRFRKDNFQGLYSFDPTFGFSGTPSNTYSTSNVFGGTKGTPASSGTTDNISVYLGTTPSNVSYKCGIYNNATLALVGTSEARSINVTASWYVFNITCSIVSGTRYVVGVFANTTSTVWAATPDETVDEGGLYREAMTYPNLENPVGAWDQTGTGISILAYCSYTVSGWSNSCPSIDNEHPVNTTIDVARYINGSVIVWDADGNSSLVTWWNNKTGSWVKFQQNNSIVANGTATCTNFTFATAQSTKYWWRVYAYDGHCNSSAIFEFTTDANISAKSWQSNYSGYLTGGNDSDWTQNYSGWCSGGNDSVSWRSNYSGWISGGNISEFIQNYSGWLSGGNNSDFIQNYTGYLTGGNATVTWQSNYSGYLTGGNATVTWQSNYSGWLTGGNGTVAKAWQSNYSGYLTGGNTTIWQQNYSGYLTGGNVSRTWQQNYTGWLTGGNVTVDAFNITLEFPINESNIYSIQPTLYFNLTHPDGYTMNYSLYIDNATLVYSGVNVSNGTQVHTSHLFYSANSTYVDYYWKVVVNDGMGNWVNETFTFQAILQGGGGITGYGAAIAIATGAIMLSVVGLIGINEKKKRRGRI